ncbi:MAG: hypothetical protein RIF41_26125, partial [Polyangiaceae bacterium]
SSHLVAASVAVAVGAVVALAACAKDRNPSEGAVTVENTNVTCRDGIDNDQDNLLDCIDFDCLSVPACQPTGDVETGEELCGDGIDNDGEDGRDCDDPKCNGFDGDFTAASFCVENTDMLCHDLSDNNGNNFADCADFSCTGECSTCTTNYCDEETEAECSDGIDNGMDGVADCDDAGCAKFCANVEET